MSDNIEFTKPSAKALPIQITIDNTGVKVKSGAFDLEPTGNWNGDGKASISKTAINDSLNDQIIAAERLARGGGGGASGAGGAGGSPPPPPDALAVAKAEAIQKMNLAIDAANRIAADSITDAHKTTITRQINAAVDVGAVDAISAKIPEASALNIADTLKAEFVLSGGKRRRKTNKRARKGRRGTRRHYYPSTTNMGSAY
jgi:hypothetical protein